jgi:hypothetical protein
MFKRSATTSEMIPCRRRSGYFVDAGGGGESSPEYLAHRRRVAPMGGLDADRAEQFTAVMR